MKRLFFIYVLVIGGLLVGCGGDNGSNGDGDIPQANLVVHDTTVAPSMINIDDPIWDTVDSTEVLVGLYRDSYGKNQNLTDSVVMMKAIKTSDKLYVRARWKDTDTDILGNYSRRISRYGDWELVDASELAGEDAIFVIFDGQDNGVEGADCASLCHVTTMRTTGGGHVDVWSWKSATTNPAFLAEDQWWTENGIGSDRQPEEAKEPYKRNWVSISGATGQPIWMHETGKEYDIEQDTFLYINDVIDYSNDDAIGGWDRYSDDDVGYIMPGHVIDTSVYTDSTPGSRWDVKAISRYDTNTHYWTVLFARSLNTDYTTGVNANDVDLSVLDSIQVTVAVTNNHTAYTSLSWNEHSGSRPFYIILNH